MIAVRRRHRRLPVLLLLLASMLVVPGAFAKGKPSGGGAVDTTKHCSQASWSASDTVIALDPGHGGSDPGTGFDFDGDGVRDLLEKDVVLNISELARDVLVEQGYVVCLTRVEDMALGNSERGDFANAVGARLFVMVHLNGSSDPNVNYTSTFWGKRRKDEVFSQHMLEALDDLTLDGGDFVAQFANGALLSATMESTLTESAFLTNPVEAENMKLENSDRRKQIATAIADGIRSYLNP